MQFSNIFDQVQFCKFAPNAKFFVFFVNKRINIKQCSSDQKTLMSLQLNGTPNQIVISPSSQLIAVLQVNRTCIRVFKITGEVVAKIEDNQAQFNHIVWTPDSFQLIVFPELLYRCTVYNLATRGVSHIKNPKLSGEKGCAFSPDGRFMSLLQKHDAKDNVGIYHVATWKLLNSILLDNLFDPVEVCWNSDGFSLLVVDSCINYRMTVLCPFRGAILKFQPYDYALGIKSFQFSNNGSFLAIGSYDEKIRLFNTLTWKLIIELDCSVTNPCSSNKTAVFQKLYRQDESERDSNRLRLMDPSTYKIPTVKVVVSEKGPPNQGIGLLEFSPDDQFLACRNGKKGSDRWNIEIYDQGEYLLDYLSSNILL